MVDKPMAIRERYVSAEEFWELAHLPENAGKHMELIEGVVYEMPPAGFEHGKRTMKVSVPIALFVDAHDLGIVTAAETGFVVHTDADGKDTILAPDIAYIAKARLPAEPIRQYARLAPDLAVEVVSPNDKAAEIHTKINKYLQYGTKMVCVVYPATRTVEVHTPSGARTLGEADTFDGGDVLPGFSLPIRDIFSA